MLALTDRFACLKVPKPLALVPTAEMVRKFAEAAESAQHVATCVKQQFKRKDAEIAAAKERAAKAEARLRALGHPVPPFQHLTRVQPGGGAAGGRQLGAAAEQPPALHQPDMRMGSVESYRAHMGFRLTAAERDLRAQGGALAVFRHQLADLRAQLEADRAQQDADLAAKDAELANLRRLLPAAVGGAVREPPKKGRSLCPVVVHRRRILHAAC